LGKCHSRRLRPGVPGLGVPGASGEGRMSLEPAVELAGVWKRFGPRVALAGVDLAIPRGQCFGFIGPNGAGKTTTFSLMCGFLRPSAGRVSVMGRSPSRPGALKAVVGVLPQDAALPSGMSV